MEAPSGIHWGLCVPKPEQIKFYGNVVCYTCIGGNNPSWTTCTKLPGKNRTSHQFAFGGLD